jgi:hypothetical protein
MKRSDEQQRPAETSASDPDREGWRQTFDGDLVKAQERFRRVAKLYENTASAAMLNRASFHLVGFLSAEYDMHGPGAGTQLHIAKDNSQHLMISILGFGDASQVSSAIARSLAKR